MSMPVEVIRAEQADHDATTALVHALFRHDDRAFIRRLQDECVEAEREARRLRAIYCYSLANGIPFEWALSWTTNPDF